MEAVIFALGGVLVSTDIFHCYAWKETAEDHGIAFDERLEKKLRGKGKIESASMMLNSAGKRANAWDVYTFAKMKDSRYLDYLNGLSPDDVLPGAAGLLKSLKAAGIMTALASSSRNAMTILEKVKLADKFDVVVDGTNIKNSKPDPEILIKAAGMLAIEPKRCLAVEESSAGIQAARACGMHTIALGAAAKAGCGDMNFSGLDAITEETLFRFLNSSDKAI